jgi:hypothetical protein
MEQPMAYYSRATKDIGMTKHLLFTARNGAL